MESTIEEKKAIRKLADRVELRPIPNKQNIRQFSPNIEFYGGRKTIGCFVNAKTHKYNTNLDEADLEYLKEQGFPFDVNDNYIPGKPHSFWDSTTSKITLEPSVVILRPKLNPVDFVKFRYLQLSKYVYTSEAEMLEGSKPEATHYIYNEDEEIKVKASNIEQKNKLVKEVSSLSPQRQREIILIILNENTDNKDADYLAVKMDDIMRDKRYSEDLRNLLEYNKEEITLRALVRKAIQSNVLRRTKQGIYFFESNLGFDEEKVREFLSEDANQEVLISIQDKLK